MSRWLDQLQKDLDRRQSQHLLRSCDVVEPAGPILVRRGRRLIHLGSNDYLGFAQDPILTSAVATAAQRLGVGSGASRLLGGHHPIHERLEQRFARFKHAEASLLMPTGYIANLAILSVLAGSDDLIVMDKLNHASLIDAARSSGATVRVYPHRDEKKLARLLERAGSYRRRLIVTDSVFSMDGDCANLPALCDLRDTHDAILIVDDAHATGLMGHSGAGLAEHQLVADAIDVTVSTASKALGSLGGVISGPRVVIDTLINEARPFLYSTAVPPTQVAAIDAALDLVDDQPQRRQRLVQLSSQLRQRLQAAGWAVQDDPTPIIPLVVGSASAALALAERLADAGFYTPAIRPPTVAVGTARVRISLRSDLDEAQIALLAEAIGTKP